VGAVAGKGGKVRPWYQSAPVVALISLAGALCAVHIGRLVSLAGLRSPGGYDATSYYSDVYVDAASDPLQGESEAVAAKKAFQKGNFEYRLGKPLEALKYFKQAVTLLPSHSFAWANLGNIQRELGLVEDAVASHRNAVAHLPSRARHWYNLGVSLYSLRDLPRATLAFRRALELNHRMASAHYNLGVALAELGQRVEAKLRYEKATSLEPSSALGAASHCNLCNLIALDDGPEAAVACLRELVAAFPDYERGLVNLAATLQLRGETAGSRWQDSNNMDWKAEAVAIHEQVLQMNPGSAIAAHALAALKGGDHVPEAASVAYVEQLFDSYSVDFDASLQSLGYQVPSLLEQAVQRFAGATSKPFNTSLDLGCGTGLCGAWMKPLSTALVGVDASLRMLEIAGSRTDQEAGTGALAPAEAADQLLEAPWISGSSAEVRKTFLYDSLEHQDLMEFLQRQPPASGDLVVAADVLCYFGSLETFFQSLVPVLSPRGIVAFTVEALLEDTASTLAPGAASDWHLDSSGRYKHSKPYIIRLASAVGLEVLSEERIIARRKQASTKADPVHAFLFVLRKPSLASTEEASPNSVRGEL